MSRRTSCTLLVLGALVLLGGGLLWGTLSGGDIVKRPAPALPTSPAASSAPLGFEEAMARLLPDVPSRSTWSGDQRAFARAVELALEGRSAEALSEARHLHRDAADPELRRRAGELAVRFAQGLGRSKAALEILERDPALLETTGLDGTDMAFASAFADAPEELWTVPSKAAEVQTRIGWLGLPEIEVVVNGCRRRLLLDTGASLTVLSASIARECGVERIGGPVHVGTSTDQSVMARWGIVDEVRLGGVAVRHHRVAVIEEEELALGPIRLDGAVGWPLFSHARVEIDFQEERTLIGPSHGRSAADRRNLFWLGYPLVRVYGPTGTPLLFEIDTGAASSSIMAPLFDKGIDHGPVEISGGLSIGVGGAERVSRRSVRGLTLVVGDRALDFEEISTRAPSDAVVVAAPDGRLGSDIGHGGVLVVDAPAGLLSVR